MPTSPSVRTRLTTFLFSTKRTFLLFANPKITENSAKEVEREMGKMFGNVTVSGSEFRVSSYLEYNCLQDL